MNTSEASDKSTGIKKEKLTTMIEDKASLDKSYDWMQTWRF